MPPPPPSSVAPTATATGRLGRLYTRAIVDDALGTMLGAVEIIDVTRRAHAGVLRDALATELNQWVDAIDHPHVFQYDAVRIVGEDDKCHVQLLATRAVARHLGSLVKEFGRLHASVVRRFVRAIVSGLDQLHQSVLRRHGPASVASLQLQQQRDVRSVAFLLLELLTGTRVSLSQLTTDHDDVLLRQLPPHSLERAFVLELMQSPTTNLRSLLLTHSYLVDDPVVSTAATGTSGHPGAGPRELIAVLIDKELSKCRDQQRSDAQQVRAWFTQFEKTFQRKPRAEERSASIQRLQRRCRTAHDRIQELESRLKVLHHVAGVTTQSTLHLDPASASAPTLDIDTTATPGADSYSGDSTHHARRRSPAQHAFLRLLSDDSSCGSTPTHLAHKRDDSDLLAARGRGHELIHQRKEVMDVIRGLEHE